MPKPSLRLVLVSTFPALVAGAGSAPAALDTTYFVDACAEDPFVANDEALQGGKVVPKDYCRCVARKLEASKASQTDFDLLTMIHDGDIAGASSEAPSYPTLEDLMIVNEGYEDACKESLGLTVGDGPDKE
ncbi:MAG: hypothetical protein ACREDO_12140 [Methyloceanibacter sp.]